ncbi:MAG: SLC13 family permease [Haloferacaceae archaeon]
MPPLTAEMLLVFGLVGVALLSFVTEALPPDTTAIGVLVALAVLEPWTGVSTAEAIAGFASPATVTIVAMYVLSEGVRQTGVVDRLGVALARATGGDERRLLGATVGTASLTAGFVNNTPVVAVFVPMITGVAERARVSPSKLLLPLSYAAMLGGTLTLVGSSTNLLASDLSRRLLDHPIGMFEFTPLGVLVVVAGTAYLLTVGRALTPARIPVDADLTEAYDLEAHLSRVVVRESSELVGRQVDAVVEEIEAVEAFDADLLQLTRDDDTYSLPSPDRVVEAGDSLVVRATLQDLNRLAGTYGLRQLSREAVVAADLRDGMGTLAEALVPPDSRFAEETVAEARLERHFHTVVLAVKRGDDLLREGLDDLVLHPGDTLLLRTTPPTLEYLRETGDLLVTYDPTRAVPGPDAGEATAEPLGPRAPVALAILAGVVLLGGLGVVPVVIAALGGVFAMVATDCLTPADAYDAVSWNVVFLLAGVLPLGVALQATGGDAFIAAALVGVADVVPVVVVLALFYLLTGLLANVITPVASVVLMIPVAVDTATRIGANEFAFLLAVTFAASGAFMTPIGYQTNLMVYGPGGYRFTDYLRVGAPLQLFLTLVVTAGIVALFGV